MAEVMPSQEAALHHEGGCPGPDVDHRVAADTGVAPWAMSRFIGSLVVLSSSPLVLGCPGEATVTDDSTGDGSSDDGATDTSATDTSATDTSATDTSADDIPTTTLDGTDDSTGPGTEDGDSTTDPTSGSSSDEGESSGGGTCGDGTVDPAEDCDDGGESATCNADCSAAACGDGITNATAGEDCDDTGESATCDADCTVATCGDGSLNTMAGEVCDDMGESATCDGDCTPASCGDGTTNVTAGEDCDDMGESATCDPDCTAAACPDGVLNPTAGEECDDGDMNDANECSNACTFNGCAFDVDLLPLTVHAGNFYGEMDFDGSCNLVVAGAFNGSLIRVTPAGVVSTLVASFGGAVSINGVAYRASDDLVYVSTDSPAQLWSVTPAGVPSLVMALPATANAIEVAPAGFGGFGDRIVGAMTNSQVLAIDPATATTSVVGTFGTILSDLVFDPSGSTVYVAAYNENQVAAMTSAGGTMVVTTANGPDGLAYAPGDRLLIANTNGTPAVTSFDLGTGGSSVIATPALDGGYYVTGLLYSTSGHALVKVAGANIDFAVVP